MRPRRDANYLISLAGGLGFEPRQAESEFLSFTFHTDT